MKSYIFLFSILIVLKVSSFGGSNQSKGYNCLFMGHSFFIPISHGMDELSKKAGFVKHKQLSVMLGGAKGTPGIFWENKKKKEEILNYLKSTKVDLVGMTYHPLGKVKFEDYERWVKVSLDANSSTNFFIGLPWVTSPVKKSTQEFEREWNSAAEEVDRVIKKLRLKYPKNTFYRLSYGQSAFELLKKQRLGKLKGFNAVSRQKDSIFKDGFGHADEILLSLSRLVWLGAIYDFNLMELPKDNSFPIDLRPIANQIIKNYPR